MGCVIPVGESFSYWGISTNGNMKEKLPILAGIAAAGGYFGHEYGHQVLGSEAITAVTIFLTVLGFGGLVLQEYAYEDDSRGNSDLTGKALTVAAIGGASFGLIHQMTHGNLFGIEPLSLNLNNTSYWLAGISAAGVYIHEWGVGRLGDY